MSTCSMSTTVMRSPPTFGIRPPSRSLRSSWSRSRTSARLCNSGELPGAIGQGSHGEKAVGVLVAVEQLGARTAEPIEAGGIEAARVDHRGQVAVYQTAQGDLAVQCAVYGPAGDEVHPTVAVVAAVAAVLLGAAAELARREQHDPVGVPVALERSEERRHSRREIGEELLVIGRLVRVGV